jgi:hypothetical protein
LHRKYKIILALVVIFAFIFFWATAEIFTLRFSGKGFYEDYSTLRTDPFGCKALYDAFSEVPGMSVSRNMRPFKEVHDSENTVIFITGMKGINPDDCRELYRFVMDAGRLVVFYDSKAENPTFLSELLKEREVEGEAEEGDEDRDGSGKERQGDIEKGDDESPSREAERKDKKYLRIRRDILDEEEEEYPISNKEYPTEEGSEEGDGETEVVDSEETEIKVVSIYERWGFDVEGGGKTVSGVKAVPSEKYNLMGFRVYPLCCSDYFVIKDDAWECVYTAGKDKPVVISRPMGKGSVVASTETYSISNEALRSCRNPEFYSWLVQDRKRLVFDEYLKGIVEERNIMWLAKKYSLLFLGMNIAVLLAFFIWKSLVSFVPGYKETGSFIHVYSEHDSLSGLVKLLKRAIKKEDLLHTCFAEYIKTVQYRKVDVKKIEAAKDILDEKDFGKDSVVSSYNDLQGHLKNVK